MSDVKTVADLNLSNIGDRMRIQTNDGAYVEGYLTRIDIREIEESTARPKLVEVFVYFDELYLDGERGSRIPYPIRTWGNREAKVLDG